MVDAKSMSELVGKTVPAQAFVQTTRNGPVWHTRADAFLQLQIDEATENTISGRITGGQMVSQNARQPVEVTGTFAGHLN
jgi:hypothetical protein